VLRASRLLASYVLGPVLALGAIGCYASHVPDTTSVARADAGPAAETTCRMYFGSCTTGGEATADDGTTAASGPSAYVQCLANTCTTSFFVGG